jgi:lysyl endopeptidase
MNMRWYAPIVLLWLGVCTTTLASTTRAETVQFNLDPLIDKAASHPTQFAVDVAHRVSSETNGHWQLRPTIATWEYAIRIPTAVTLAFHAKRLLLPPNGVLTLTAGGQTYTYRAQDLHRTELWSRLVRGDEIALAIRVPRSERAQTLLEIASFQAGYRSLVPGLPDNAHYQRLKTTQPLSTSSTCVQNYTCDATASNQSQANSTVAVIVGNQFGCSGTLINDVPEDGVPYVLTARHCENGEPGGGDPGAASSVDVYWNATTPCGQTLVSVFDASTEVQDGATTVVEQQDEWLIRLDTPPAASNAYFAGWNVSGAPIIGGFSIDYSNADTQQYVAWAGTAVEQSISAATLGVGYSATFWGVVNSLGSVDHGASGTALFDSNGHAVGVLSRAIAGQCPANPPPTPSASTAVALYNDMAATWSSTADPTSTTGAVTLATALDPSNTGTLTQEGIAGVPPSDSLTASQLSSQVGSAITLSFTASTGSVCTASGGLSGDGWIGTIAANPFGSSNVTETSAGNVTYVLTCASGSRSATAKVTVTWTLAPPTLSLQASSAALTVGVPTTLSWTSSATTCTASGGAAGDGWSGTLPSSGQRTVTETTSGSYTYTLTCTASGTPSVTQSVVVNYSAKFATLIFRFEVPSTLRVGQSITLFWEGSPPCTTSGGASGDGWSSVQTGFQGQSTLTETTAGTYTYVVSCGPSNSPSVAQVSETFTNDPPTAVLTATSAQQTINLSTYFAPEATLTWLANVEPCSINYTGPATGSDVSDWPAQGSYPEAEEIAGLYTYTLTCGSGSTQATDTATITWLQASPPQVTLTASSGPEEILPGTYLTWNTNVLPCTGSGGTPGDGWNGPLTFSPGYVNSTLVKESAPGTYTYVLTCGIAPTAQAQTSVVFNNAAGNQLTFAAATQGVFTGQTVKLSWNSTLSPCTGYGGSATDGWDTTHPAQGSAQLSEPAGQYLYSLVCGSGSLAVEAQVYVSVSQANSVYISWVTTPGIGAVGKGITLAWMAEQAATCTGTGGASGDGWAGPHPNTGSVFINEKSSGEETYTLTCQNGSLSDQASWTTKWVAATTATLVSSAHTAVFGMPFTLTWNSSNANSCIGSWPAAAASAGVSGSSTIEETSGASHTYSITCSGNYSSAQAQVTVSFVPGPVVSLSASPTSATVGVPITLTWTSSNDASCSASGGSSADGWSGTKPLSGSNSNVTENSAGAYTYIIQCTGDGETASANAVVTFAAAASGSPGTSSSHGGGSLDWFGLITLAVVVSLRAVMRKS